MVARHLRVLEDEVIRFRAADSNDTLGEPVDEAFRPPRSHLGAPSRHRPNGLPQDRLSGVVLHAARVYVTEERLRRWWNRTTLSDRRSRTLRVQFCKSAWTISDPDRGTTAQSSRPSGVLKSSN